VDTFQLTIEIPKLEYTAPEKIGARVYIVNTKRTEKSFVISDFYFKVYNDLKTIYEFSYPNAVQGSVQALGRRLVFNLEENVFLANLPGGTYTIYARCKINGKLPKFHENSYIKRKYSMASSQSLTTWLVKNSSHQYMLSTGQPNRQI